MYSDVTLGTGFPIPVERIIDLTKEAQLDL
jgi:hypothetical protein